MSRWAMVAAGLLGSVVLAWGQTPAEPPAPSPAVSPESEVPAPYRDDEFPRWVLDLRRAEIIAVGAFPVAYLLVGLGYDYGYYASSGFPQANVPWPLGPGTSRWTASTEPDRLQQKNWTLVGVSVGVCLLIAGADWLLRDQ